MKKEVVCILHSPLDTAGLFETFFISKGYSFKTIVASEAQTHDFDLATSCDLLLVMGGAMGVYDKEEFPFLKKELSILEERLKEGAATIGICLGAQLLVAAAGGRVYLSDKEEFGWFPLNITQDGLRDPVISDKGLWKEPVFHWHQDAFDLPSQAKNLLYSDRCPSQAFSLAPNIYGFQFHLELNVRELPEWIAGEPDLNYGNSPGTQSRETILSQGELNGDNLKKTAFKVLENYYQL